MVTGKLTEDRFDEVLGQSLRRHSEPVPAGFTERMLSRIEEAEQQKILARVVLQERLALAGCLIFGALAAVGITVFPGRISGILRGILANVTERGGAFIEGIGQSISIENIRSEWQLYTILALVIGLAVVCLADMLIGDRFRMA
jgi:hypothetical protein